MDSLQDFYIYINIGLQSMFKELKKVPLSGKSLILLKLSFKIKKSKEFEKDFYINFTLKLKSKKKDENLAVFRKRF